VQHGFCWTNLWSKKCPLACFGFPVFSRGDLRFSLFFFRCLLAQVLPSWVGGKAILERLKALEFRVLRWVSFSLSKLLLLERVSTRSCCKGGNRHRRRKFVRFRSSFVHQGGLPDGIFWWLLSRPLLLPICAWSSIVSVCGLERRTKAQDALECNRCLPSVWTSAACANPCLILDRVCLRFEEENRSYVHPRAQPKSRGCATGTHLCILFSLHRVGGQPRRQSRPGKIETVSIQSSVMRECLARMALNF